MKRNWLQASKTQKTSAYNAMNLRRNEGRGRSWKGRGKKENVVNTVLMYEILTIYNWMDLQSTETNQQHIP